MEVIMSVEFTSLAAEPFARAVPSVKRGWLRVCCWAVLLVGAGAAHAVPEIQHWTNDRGSRVFFARTEGLPLVDIRVLFDAGSARDEQQFGLASLTAGMLDTGAGDWDADAIAQRLEGVGAAMSTSASRDSASLTLRTLTKPELMEVALATARDVLLRPRFAQADFDREKKRVLLAIKQREEEPDELAGLAFFRELYGSHPYAHPKEGNYDTVEKLTRDDLVRFYGQYYVARNATVVIVGELDRTAAEAIANQLVGGLPEGQAVPPIPGPTPKTAANTLRQPFPSEQTHVLTGVLGMKINDPDYFPLYVGNHILGGSGFASRVVKEVREKRGLSYSAYSYFYPFRETGPFLMGLQTKNDQAEQALSVLQQTLKDFLAKGPNEEELKAAKQNITGGFVLRLDSNKKLAEQIASIGYYGMPLDWLNTFIARVEAVTPADIQRVFGARIHADQLQTVLVGAANRGQ
jgi:zinc protease